MANTDRADLEKSALEILQNRPATVADVMRLADALVLHRSFGYARRLYARARRNPQAASKSGLQLKLAQQEALCTYQDPDQPENARFDRALEILAEVEDLYTTRN